MRVAVITSTGRHHKHFVARLAKSHEVVAVFHPRQTRGSLAGRVRKARAEVGRRGLTYTALRGLAAVHSPLLGWDATAAHDRAERDFFPDADGEYTELVGPLAREVADMNGSEGIELVRAARPDAVVCLGGLIYQRPLIEACGLMLNFHSGISPIYNGTATIMFAFANGHVDLCGGTLMTMSPVIDGGDILGHYLPAVEPDDDPATLFMKTIVGAVETATRFLSHLDRHGSFARCAQPRPLFYCRAADLTLYQTQRIRQHLEQGLVKRHLREERLVPYWHLGEGARDELTATLQSLLGIA